MPHALPAPPAPPAPAPDAAVAEFWVDALHELAQPVQALALFVSTCAVRKMGRSRAPVVGHLGSAVQDLQRLLRDLALVAQLDADHLPLSLQAVPVDHLLGPLRASMSIGTLSDKVLRWRSQGQVVDSDPVLLARLIQVLIDHALAQAPAGGVLLAWRNPPVQDAVRLELWWAHAARHAPVRLHNFVPFAGAKEAPGSGLDLYTAQRLAQLLGSRLHLRLVPGGLACLSLRLPKAACGA